MAQPNIGTTNNPPMQPPDSQPTKPRVTHAYKFVKRRKLHRHGTAKEGNEKARPRKATRRHGQGRQRDGTAEEGNTTQNSYSQPKQPPFGTSLKSSDGIHCKTKSRIMHTSV